AGATTGSGAIAAASLLGVLAMTLKTKLGLAVCGVLLLAGGLGIAWKVKSEPAPTVGSRPPAVSPDDAARRKDASAAPSLKPRSFNPANDPAAQESAPASRVSGTETAGKVVDECR